MAGLLIQPYFLYLIPWTANNISKANQLVVDKLVMGVLP